MINVITKQGSERFLFDASWYWQTSGLTSQPVRLPVRDTSEESGCERGLYRDLTTTFGGPLDHDRLWFFTGYQHIRDSDSQPGTDPRFPRRYEQDKVIAKLTWRPAARWQVFSSFHDEFWVNPQQPTIARPFEATLRSSASVLLVDVLNALNDTAEEGIVTDALTTATIPRVPTFGMPNVFIDPRRAMVGMRIDLGRP